MRLRIRPAAGAILAAACAAGPSWSAEPVTVTNFPEVQRIRGEVVVAGPIPQTRFERVKALVTPAAPPETGQWTEAGVLDTQGFTHVTLSLAGSLQGSPQGGSVGVALVPDVPELLHALRTQGVAQFALRAEAEVSTSQGGLFSSPSTTLRLGFPRYRVFFYNTASKNAEAVVYAYLSGS